MVRHYIQASTLPLSSDRQSCVDSVKALVSPSDTYSMLEIPYDEDIEKVTSASDIMRMQACASDPNAVWVDTDVELLSLNIPNDGKPYVDFLKGNPHYAIIAVNGNNLFFKNILDIAVSRWGKDLTTYPLAWPIKILRNLSLFLGTIPSDTYVHSFLTHGNLV